MTGVSSYPVGVDVSSYQPEINWPTLKNNVAFVFVKATEGMDIVDPYFNTYMNAARQAGLPVGAYHFFHPKDDVQTQIDLFINTVGALQPGDLPPVLDIENPEEWSDYSMDERQSMVQEWLEQVSQQLGINPILYTSAAFVEEILGNAAFLASYPFWVAEYTTATKPTVPTPFPFWTFWQHSESGTVAGISATVDLDYFNGSLAQLEKFRQPAPTLTARLGAFIGSAWKKIWS